MCSGQGCLSLERPVRLLLAGNNAYDMAAAQRFLQQQNVTVVTCSSGRKTTALLTTEPFDVVIAEASPSGSHVDDAVKACDLLACSSTSPIAVVLDVVDENAVKAALAGGFVDIFAQPLSGQKERLLELLERVRQLRVRNVDIAGVLAYTSRVREAAAVAFPGTAVQDASYINTLFMPGSDDSTGPPDWRGISATHSWNTAELPSTDCLPPPLVDQSFPGDFAGFADESCFSQDFASMDSSLRCQSNLQSGASREREVDNSSLSCFTSESLSSGKEGGDERCAKKAKVEWTGELHTSFVDAVEALGVDKAVPSKILEKMGPVAVGLTRQNIASHLQKYRNRLVRKKTKPTSTPSVFPPFAALPVPAAPMTIGLPCWVPSMPFPGFPAACMPWQPPLCIPPATEVAVPSTPSISDEVQHAIRQALADDGKGFKSPLGLKLDFSSVLEATCHNAQ